MFVIIQRLLLKLGGKTDGVRLMSIEKGSFPLSIEKEKMN